MLFKDIFTKVNNIDLPINSSIIWGGDVNIVTDLALETAGGNPKIKVGSLEQLHSILKELDLCDIWRIRNPQTKRFTWRGSGQGPASNSSQILHRRLDYFFISDHLQPSIDYAEIIPAPATDHSAISISFNFLPQFKHGPSIWKLNNSLLNDIKYVKMIEEVLSAVKKDFDVNNIQDPHLRWELIKYEVRKASITFAKGKAKNSRTKYSDLELKLMKIEQIENWVTKESLTSEYEYLKKQLNERSDYITEGLILRSKTTWVEQGEKSNKYFLNLEKQRKSKTHVRKILESNGKVTTNPNEILKMLKSFYGNLYSRRNSFTEDECLEFIHCLDLPRLNEEEKNKCEGSITQRECYECLKKMSNNKTPGNDGLTKEFYLVFWSQLVLITVLKLEH